MEIAIKKQTNKLVTHLLFFDIFNNQKKNKQILWWYNRVHQVGQIYTFIEMQSLRISEKIKFQNFLFCKQD